MMQHLCQSLTFSLSHDGFNDAPLTEFDQNISWLLLINNK